MKMFITDTNSTTRLGFSPGAMEKPSEGFIHCQEVVVMLS
jgi:hypothetical protein